MANEQKESTSWWPPEDEPTEYPLPCDNQATNDIEPISPWLASISRFDGDQVLEILEEVWDSVAHPGSRALRDRLLTYTPNSIIIHDGQGWLSLGSRVGCSIYISPPPESKPDAAGFDSLEKFDTQSLLEFYKYFPGLRESLPGTSGSFVDPHDWASVADYGWDLEAEDDSWSGGLVIFESLNGDLLLLNASSGSLAWCQISNHRLRHLCDSFDDFLEIYARFLDKNSIIDSYSLRNTDRKSRRRPRT